MNQYLCKTAVFLSLLVIFVCLIFRFTVIEGQNREIDQLRASYLNARIAAASDKNRMNSSMHRVEDDLKKIIDSLPAFNEFPYVLKDIIDLIGKKNLKSSTLLFKPVKTERLAMWQYSSAFSVQGSYADLKSFVAEFQALPGINIISTLFFKSKPEMPGEVNLDISIAVYCRAGV